jgi:hypothetical protein
VTALSPISLDRADDILETSFDAVEQMLSSPENIKSLLRQTGSRADSFSSDIGTTPTRWRSRLGSRGFLGFIPPDAQRLSEAHLSQESGRNPPVGTNVPGRRVTPSSIFSQAVESSTRQTGRITETHTPDSDQMDYPDPYGIMAEASSVPVTARRDVSTESGSGPSDHATQSRQTLSSQLQNSRASPILAESRGSNDRRSSPRIMPFMEGKAREKISTLVDKTGALSLGQTAVAVINKAGRYSEDQWDTYKAKRCQVLLDWWKGVLDEVSIVLAVSNK